MNESNNELIIQALKTHIACLELQLSVEECMSSQERLSATVDKLSRILNQKGEMDNEK